MALFDRIHKINSSISELEKKINTIEVFSLTLLFFKLAAIVFVVWFWGYIGFSVSWLFLPLFAYILNEKYRRQKKLEVEIGHEVATNEQQIISKISDLPSWVFFPDIEKAEWLNKITRQLWPYISTYVQNLLRTVIEPMVKEKLPDFLRSFKFVKIDLGDIAPRIGGIKVYSTDQVRRDEIILDVEIYYYGDSDMKINIRGITAGIKDLEIRGMLRVSLRPLMPRIPLVGAVTIAFLNSPTLNFDLTDFADALDLLPGARDMLQSAIQDVVGKLMVLPNRLPVPLVKDLKEVDIVRLRHPIPAGVVRVHVMSAENLKRADFKLVGEGKSDPYCVIRLGANTFKTRVIPNTINPEWNEVFEGIADECSGQDLTVEVFDKDQGNKDDFLGRSEVDLEAVSKTGRLDTWLHLEEVKSGSIHLRITWLSLSPSPGAFTDAYAQVEDDSGNHDTHLHAGYLQVVVDSARNLPFVKRSEEPSPYAVLQLGRTQEQTRVIAQTPTPAWEDVFSFLVSNPHVDTLSVTVKDKKTNSELGFCHVALKLLLSEPNMVVNRPFTLRESNPDAAVQLRLTLRAMALRRRDASGPDEDQEEVEAALERLPEPAADSGPSSAAPGSPSRLENGAVGLSVPPGSPARSDVSAEVRRRAAGGGDPEELDSGLHQCGRVQLTLRYSGRRMCLVVVVHKATQLIACDEDGSSDPYVKLLIVPKSVHTKKKTQVIKNCLSPVFDETFDLPIAQADLARSTLRLEMRNHVGRFSRGRKHMGHVEIPLGRFDLGQAVTSWFDLLPADGNNNQDHSSLGSTNA